MLNDGILSCRRAGFLPVTLALLLGTGVVVAYIWAVVRDDVVAWLPYISQAGGNPPQSGVFGIFLYLSASIGLITILVRYIAIHKTSFLQQHTRCRYLNHVSLLFGFICIIGMIVVASYPVNSNTVTDCNKTMPDPAEMRETVVLPHTLGAFFIFVVGIVYAFCQALLSLFLRPPTTPGVFHNKHPWIFGVRCFLCLLALVSLFVMIFIKVDTSGGIWESNSTTTPKAFAEWVLALMLVLLFLTLYSEMKAIRLEFRVLTLPGGAASGQPDEDFGSASQIVPRETGLIIA